MTEQQLEARVSGARVLLFLVLLAVAVLVVWVAVTAVWHFPQPVYRLTPTRLLVTLAACAGALAALRGLWRLPAPRLSAMALVMACLWVLTPISYVAIALMPFTLGLSLVFALTARKDGGAGAAILRGLGVALSLAVLLLAQPWTAAVSCGESSVSTGGRPFDGSSGSSSGSGISAAMPEDPTLSRPVFESAGNVDLGGDRYVYRCRDGELLEFRRVG